LKGQNASIKEVIQKSLEINEKYDWVMNLQNLVDNINNSQHRITGYTPNKNSRSSFRK